MDLSKELLTHINQAFLKHGLQEDISLQLTSNPKFGDYQINNVMSVAKKLQQNPFELAEKIAKDLNLDGIAEKIDVVKPGFINIFLDKKYLSAKATKILNSPDLAITKQRQQTIVIDYSCPNLAKEMHVGHLRSTIIGDAINRILTFLGHNVIAQNHVGDWGTQFGMLTAYLTELDTKSDQEFLLSDLEQFYRQAKIKFDEDENFANKARQFVVMLQSGDKEILKIWRRFVDISMQHCQEIYDLLSVLLTEQSTMGESQYNHLLQPIVDELIAKNIAVDDAGAKVVFLHEIMQQDDKPTPLIVQKQDGGFLYATTDLAAIYYRVNTLKANKIIYVTDSRQSLHFKEVFLTAQKAKFVTDDIELTHVAFGSMLAENGKPFKTREGKSFKLLDLLNDSINKAKIIINKKSPQLLENEIDKIAKAIGISAVKYSDLSKNRINDYIFNLQLMLSFDGNTAPYLQYTYTRISNVINKAGIKVDHTVSVATGEPIEKQLVLSLLQFENILYKIATTYNVHYLAGYLYDIATLASQFYEHCPILSAEDGLKKQRLQLAKLTANTLKTGMNLLGLEVLDVM